MTLIDTNGRPLATKFVSMHCNGTWAWGVACKNQATRGARLIVPAATMETPEFKPIRQFVDAHACDAHVNALGVTAQDLLTREQKTLFETAAKKIRPAGFKCDFEQAFIEWVLTTTPEYRQFLQRLDDGHALAALKSRGMVS